MDQINLKSIDSNTKSQLLQRLKNNHKREVDLESQKINSPLDHSSVFQALPFSERMFLRLKENKYANILPLLLKIEGEFDLTVLNLTIHLLTKKYPVLRSSFFTDSANVLQQNILNDTAIKIAVHFLSEDISEQNMMDKFLLEANEKFDSAVYPLFRTKVFIVNESLNYVTFSIHHLITDEISSGLLIKSFSLFYFQLKKNSNYTIPDHRGEFINYIKTKWNYLNGAQGYKNELYWNSFLKNNPISAIPLQQKCEVENTSNRENVSVSYDTLHAIKDRYRNLNQLSYFSIFLVYFALSIKEFFSTDHFVINFSSANRAESSKSFEHMGCFANLLPIFFSIEDNSNIESLFSRVTSQCLEGIAHENFNIMNIYKDFADKKNALTQFVFSYLNAGAPEVSIPNAKVESFDLPRLEVNYLIFFVLREYPSGIKGFIEYDNRYLSKNEIESLIQLFHKFIS